MQIGMVQKNFKWIMIYLIDNKRFVRIKSFDENARFFNFFLFVAFC